ncbi:hypothetical protein KJ763_02555 [Patescibacteria group bacterium]|nr:hypothetical protein [Patescibacteria group bacterium]
MRNIRFFLGIGFIIILVISFTFFGFYKAKDFLNGPKINIDSPDNGQVVSISYLEIKGSVKNIASLNLNGLQIFTDEKGFFKQGLLLAKGYSIIKISAQDKFGRSVEKKLGIIFK